MLQFSMGILTKECNRASRDIKEINALTSEIETKTASVGELGVQLVTEKEDLDDTQKALGKQGMSPKALSQA